MVLQEDKITTIKLKQSTRKRLQRLRKYSRETNEEILIRLIKRELISANHKEVTDQVKTRKGLNLGSEKNTSDVLDNQNE